MKHFNIHPLQARARLFFHALPMLAAWLLFALVAPHVQAQGWPDRAVTLIVPYPAGSPTDAYVRGVAKGLSQLWKQPVVIDNRPGANEAIAVATVTRAPNNGYTLLASTEGGLLLNPLLHRKLSHNPDTQLVPISLLIKGPLVLSASAGFPAGTLKEFLAYAKVRAADPIRYGTPGLGGTIHLSFSAFEKEQKLALTHVPYKGNNLVLQDILGGHVEAGALAPSLVEPFIKSGKVKGLAVSSERRLVSLPDVPTFTELGVSDMNAVYFIALSAPVGTAQDIVQKIAQDARTVVTAQAFKDRFADPVGLVTVASTPGEFAQYLKAERVVQKSGSMRLAWQLRIDAPALKRKYMTNTLESRLQRVEDQLAISDLRARYCHLLDEMRWVEFIDLFTEDGVFQGLSQVTGRAALMAFFSTQVPTFHEKFWHFCTNDTLVLDGDTATGRTSMEFISVTDGVSYVSAGHYDDEIVRVGANWKFKSRRITFYFYSPLSDGFTGNPPLVIAQTRAELKA